MHGSRWRREETRPVGSARAGPGASRRPYRGDYTSAEWAHTEIEYVILRASEFAPVSVQGRVEMREAARSNIDAWADLRITAERYIEVDPERVLVLDNISGRGKRSGLDIQRIAAGSGSAHLFRVTGGKVLRLVAYEDRDRALAELGLEGPAVSRVNVEIVRAALDAFMRGDWESAFRDVAPNYELDVSRSLNLTPMPGVYRGEEAQRLQIDFFESWQSVRTEPHEFIEVGEHVVVPQTTHFVGRDGIGVQARNTWTFTIRDGMIVRACLYHDKQEALNAVGLEQ